MISRRDVLKFMAAGSVAGVALPAAAVATTNGLSAFPAEPAANSADAFFREFPAGPGPEIWTGDLIHLALDRPRVDLGAKTFVEYYPGKLEIPDRTLSGRLEFTLDPDLRRVSAPLFHALLGREPIEVELYGSYLWRAQMVIVPYAGGWSSGAIDFYFRTIRHLRRDHGAPIKHRLLLNADA